MADIPSLRLSAPLGKLLGHAEQGSAVQVQWRRRGPAEAGLFVEADRVRQEGRGREGEPPGAPAQGEGLDRLEQLRGDAAPARAREHGHAAEVDLAGALDRGNRADDFRVLDRDPTGPSRKATCDLVRGRRRGAETLGRVQELEVAKGGEENGRDPAGVTW